MGSFYPGVPRNELKKIQENFSASIFVETGSYLGDTAKWASEFFPRVVTIEADKNLFDGVKKRFADNSRVETLFGNSEVVLSQLVPTIKDPAIFWLDAHWCGPGTFGDESECPLLTEIEILNKRIESTVILVDDARLFLAPPPRPHKPDQWPSVSQVVEKLNQRSDKEIYIWRDVIFAIPKNLITPFQNIIQDLYEQKT